MVYYTSRAHKLDRTPKGLEDIRQLTPNWLFTSFSATTKSPHKATLGNIRQLIWLFISFSATKSPQKATFGDKKATRLTFLLFPLPPNLHKRQHRATWTNSVPTGFFLFPAPPNLQILDCPSKFPTAGYENILVENLDSYVPHKNISLLPQLCAQSNWQIFLAEIYLRSHMYDTGS